MKRTNGGEKKREQDREEWGREREKEKKQPITARDELELTTSARTPLTDYFLQSKSLVFYVVV
ncbi:hypothetical protein T12_13993 [Trichinella patagoniensis]|uniref:Uncharacterized protein n=1 Tax=Trichinella patagoniensis TaxID=990121 RepID=A0A0V0ZRS8_9BILA|nr:hypothetical protein T12_13993 [Trichinella patagoniensis]